jgi:soluble lytic murein transglycosylase-like protein
MPKPSSTPAWPALFKVLKSATVLLLLTSPLGWAQESASRASAASADETFSAFYQAVSATASDLLASAQHPLGQTPSKLVPLSKESVSLTTSAGVLENQGLGNQENQALTRLKVLRPILEQILREEAVPPELVGVVVVESGGVPTALSPKGARGIWQFMPDTARRYGLTVGSELDERLDIYKSTRAAAHYLRDLYSQFGSWPLAFAAYNAGEELVERAVVRSSSRDFDVIASAGLLPVETVGYVPAVMKAIVLMRTLNDVRLTAAARKAATRQAVYAMSEMEN